MREHHKVYFACPAMNHSWLDDGRSQRNRLPLPTGRLLYWISHCLHCHLMRFHKVLLLRIWILLLQRCTPSHQPPTFHPGHGVLSQERMLLQQTFGVMLHRPQLTKVVKACHLRPNMSLHVANQAAENITLPASTYKEVVQSDPSDNGDDGILLPFALDPNPAPGPSPLGKSRKYNEGPVETGHSRNAESKSGRDYFNRPMGNTAHRDVLKENRPGSSRSTSTERERQTPKPASVSTPQPTSPHIAYQEKIGRAHV